MNDYKMAIVVRSDLGMTKGKIAAQVAHAAVALAYDVMDSDTENQVATWFWDSQKKIVLRVDSLEQIHQIASKCSEVGIRHTIIQDLGLTQIEPNTTTCIGIGPDTTENIDKITAGLKLL